MRCIFKSSVFCLNNEKLHQKSSSVYLSSTGVDLSVMQLEAHTNQSTKVVSIQNQEISKRFFSFFQVQWSLGQSVLRHFLSLPYHSCFLVTYFFEYITVNSCFQECALATIIPFQMTPEIKSNHDSFLVDGCALRADMDIGYVPSSSTAVGEVLHCCTYMRQHSSCVQKCPHGLLAKDLMLSTLLSPNLYCKEVNISPSKDAAKQLCDFVGRFQCSHFQLSHIQLSLLSTGCELVRNEK